MLFAHGFGCDQNMWRLIEPSYAKRYRTVLFDHVGSGGSDLSAYDARKYASLQGYADDMVELVREFTVGKAVFVGHSVSAMIGALASLKAPDMFSKLVMVGPSPRYIDDGDYVGGFHANRSRNCSNFLPKIIWAGRLRWHRQSWAIPIGRSWAQP